jgi:hypothetical protein
MRKPGSALELRNQVEIPELSANSIRHFCTNQRKNASLRLTNRFRFGSPAQRLWANNRSGTRFFDSASLLTYRSFGEAIVFGGA